MPDVSVQTNKKRGRPPKLGNKLIDDPSYMKKYRRDYYRIRYHLDQQFKSTKKDVCAKKYNPKHIVCRECLYRIKKEIYESYYYSIDGVNTVCKGCYYDYYYNPELYHLYKSGKTE